MDKKLLSQVVKYAKIIIGTALFAVGFQFFAYPNDISSGGVTGVAMITNYLTGLPVGVVSIIINIPLFAFSWKKFGLEFIISSLVGMLGCSIFVDLFSMIDLVVTKEPLLAAVYSGIIKGLGCGIVFSTSATTGGVDIVARYLRVKYQHINFSTFILALDAAVIGAFAVIFKKYDSAMYALISMFLCSKVIDIVLFGAVNSKVCYIITDESSKMKTALMNGLHRGVTLLHGEGAWSGNEKDVILCVIKSRQIVELKHIINKIDPKSFLILCDSREVFGTGFNYIGDEK